MKNANSTMKCRTCGCLADWDSPRKNWPICKDCMIDHCTHANCLTCNYGTYPDCEFLEMKLNHRDKT